MHGWRNTILAASLIVGCQSSAKAPYADNPLVMSREPLKQAPLVAVKPTPANSLASPVVPPASAKPKAAAQPTSAAKPKADVNKSSIIATSATTVTPIGPMLPEPEMPKATPLALRTAPVKPPTATPMLEVKEPVLPKLAHAEDYTWLVGAIDVHYRGHKELRFCPFTEENAIGGKVRLVDDPQLADLKAGTMVRVEGELVRDDPLSAAGQYPRYHVRSVQVIEKPR